LKPQTETHKNYEVHKTQPFTLLLGGKKKIAGLLNSHVIAAVASTVRIIADLRS
jgi:hypothetical protein